MPNISTPFLIFSGLIFLSIEAVTGFTFTILYKPLNCCFSIEGYMFKVFNGLEVKESIECKSASLDIDTLAILEHSSILFARMFSVLLNSFTIKV